MATIRTPNRIRDGFCNSQDLKCKHLQFMYGEFDFCLSHIKHVSQKKTGSPINKKLTECSIDPMSCAELWHPSLNN